VTLPASISRIFLPERFTTANLACERASAATDELNRLIAAAEAREAVQQIEEQAAEAARAKERLTTIFSEIDSRTEQIKLLFVDAVAPLSTLARWNRLAEKTGQADRRIAFTDPVAIKLRLVGQFK
jgi:hypothetical protein